MRTYVARKDTLLVIEKLTPIPSYSVWNQGQSFSTGVKLFILCHKKLALVWKKDLLTTIKEAKTAFQPREVGVEPRGCRVTIEMTIFKVEKALQMKEDDR